MISFNRKTWLSLGTGLVFSVLALYFTFVNIPLGDLVDYLKKINYWWIIPSLLIAIFSYILRIWRWQIILYPVKRSGFKSAFHPLVIGFMLNCILPGRIGEIARPVIYYKREHVAFSKVLGTVGIERILDALCLLGFFIYIMAGITIDPSINITFAGYQITPAVLDMLWRVTLKFSIVLVGLIILVCFSRTRALLNKTIMWLPDILIFLKKSFREKIRERLCTKITGFLDHLSVGFEILKSPGYLILCLALSIVLWWLLGYSVYVLSLGCPGIHVSILQAFAVEIIICFAIMLPSVPGYWGLWEAGGVFGLMVFGIPAKEAAGMTLAYHFFHLIPIILIGLVSAMITGFDMVKAKKIGEEDLETLGHGKEEISCERGS